jgi:hypothetical protein
MPFDQYVKYVASNRRNINTVITQATFDTDSATPKLFFDAVAHVNKDQYEMAIAAGETDEAKRAISYTVAQTDGVTNKKALPKPAEESAEESVEEAEVAEPKKREGKASKAEPAPKKDLQDIMKQWAE